MTTNPVHSRFYVHSAGAAPFPNKCAVCGSVNRDLVDFGMEAEVEGAVMFCVECTASAADRIGWINPDKYLEVVNDLANTTMNLDRAVAEIRNFRNDLADRVDNLGSNIDSLLAAAPVSSPQQSEEDVLEVFRGTGKEGPTISGLDGQDDGDSVVERPNDISSGASDGPELPRFTL